MSVHAKFEREDAADGHSEQEHSLSEVPLRTQLVQQLMKLAQDGNVQAIRELLDRPDLLEVEPKQTLEECKANIAKMLLEMRAKWKQHDRDFCRKQFEFIVRERLEHEGRTVPFRRWEALSAELKGELWQQIIACLMEGEDVVLGQAESQRVQ